VDRTVNLFAMLDQATRRFPDRGALHHGDRRVCTWGELRDRALRLATSIRQQEGAGACVAIASHNRPEAFGPIFAQIYGQGESPITITGLRRTDHETGDDAVLGSVGDSRGGMEARSR
jgi:acyl-CoA synthetase (AMP-forming)/AMP-acid ligase II